MRPEGTGSVPGEDAGTPVTAAGRSRTLLYIVIGIVIAFLIIAGIAVYMGGQCGVTCSYAPSASAACTGENITITYLGGGKYPSPVVNVTAYDGDFTRNRTVGGADGVLPAGSVLVLDGPFFSPAHIIAIAESQDGAMMVIVDTSLQCGTGPAGAPSPAPHPG